MKLTWGIFLYNSNTEKPIVKEMHILYTLFENVQILKISVYTFHFTKL